jgi:serine/threonine protein kinase/Tol biopolymer transport system component
MPLASGVRLGPYEIQNPLGAGGMGEVYRARDSKLKRDVAIKVLPEAFARDPERLARFEREAEVLATLNHPNIAHIYGLEGQDGRDGQDGRALALVMEFVDGPTLADRIALGPIPIDEVLPIARQIVEAMIAAHEKGIIHRDLKPANIKITSDSKVKVLDFGLARASDPLGVNSGINVTALPTITSPAMMTGVGVVLGTAAYMSPEQARGRAVDARADIWAFGALLYEMLTGRRAFPGDDVTETIANIVKTEPDWSALPPDTSVAVRALLRRCLQKDPDRRLRHIADARFNLEDAETLALPAPRLSAPARVLPWAVAACALAAAAASWLMSGRTTGQRDARPVTRLEMGLPDGVELFTSSARTIGVSPDGRRIAYIGIRSGSRQVYVRALDRNEATPVRGTDGATALFFSPDGQSIGLSDGAGVLKTVSLADGVSATVGEDANFIYGGAWLPGDRIIFGRSAGGLWQVGRSGGAATRLTTIDSAKRETIHSSPIPTPDGKAMLFSVFAGDQWHVEAVVLATGERSTVVERALFPLLAVPGYLFFYRDGGVLAAPFDLARLRVTGAAVRMLDGLQAGEGGNPLFDMSAAGVMVYPSTSAVSRLMWVSRDGAEQPLNDVPRSYASPRLSPDGTRVLVQASGLWIQDLARATFTRVATGGEQANAFPIWTPDSRRIIVRGARGLTLHDADGSGRSEVIPGTSNFDYPASVAADNDTLVMLRSSQDTSFDIYRLSLRDPSTLRPILKTRAYEGGARLSPDEKWLSYVSNESGQNEVYVRPFAGPDRRWPVSTQGGTQAIWNPNGREIFYRNGNKMMAVDVTAAPDLKLSPPHLLFEQPYAFSAGITIPNYDVSRDGRRFLMVKNEAGAGRLNVVLNAFADLPK